MSVYGIETEDDCRKKIDELLEKTRRVGETMNEESVADLKADLKRYFDLRNDKKMSAVDRTFFRAIHEAYLRSPHLGRRQTWRTGLYEIEWKLKFMRPKEK